MAKEILLYGDIWNYSVASFMEQMEAAKSDDIAIRVNSNGGSPEDVQGLISKLQEHKGGKKLKGDGKCYSTAAYLFCYADKEDTECLETTQFMFHRAGYPKWIESNAELFTQALKDNAARVNGFLRPALENRIDAMKLQALKGVTMDELFAMDDRKEIYLTANEAKEIGLVGKVNKVTPEMKARIAALEQEATTINAKLAAQYSGQSQEPKTNQKPKVMNTIQELKAQYPDLCKQIADNAVKEERIRVGAWTVFIDVDAKRVADAIENGEEMNFKNQNELLVKKFSKGSIAAIESDSAEPVNTPEQPVNAAAVKPEIEAAQKKEKELFDMLGLKQA